MTSGSSLVLFIFLVPVSVLSQEITKECGENIDYIPECDKSCNSSLEIIKVLLTMKIKDNLWTEVKTDCSDNRKFCVEFGEDKKNLTLRLKGVTFEDKGGYALRITRSDGRIQTVTFNIFVKGVCEPKLSSSADTLTCEVDVESTYKPTIVWMDKHRKIYRDKTFPKTLPKYQDTLKLTDETREVEMCCTVSYEKEGKKEEKQTCQIRPSHVGAGEVMDTNNKKMIVVPILCVLVLAIGVALFILQRRRMSFTQKNRERTLSETGLMEDHRAENMEGASSEPLQRHQDQV